MANLEHEKIRKQGRQKKIISHSISGHGHHTKMGTFDADSGKDLAVEVREIFIQDFSAWKIFIP